MENKGLKFYPCIWRCFGILVPSLLWFIIVLLECIDLKLGLLILFGLPALIICLISGVYFMIKGNSVIYIQNYFIKQKQYKKIITIDFNEIDDIKLSKSFIVRAPALLTIYSNDKKIFFEAKKKNLDKFYSVCENDVLNKKIKEIIFQYDCGTYKF